MVHIVRRRRDDAHTAAGRSGTGGADAAVKRRRTVADIGGRRETYVYARSRPGAKGGGATAAGAAAARSI